MCECEFTKVVEEAFEYKTILDKIMERIETDQLELMREKDPEAVCVFEKRTFRMNLFFQSLHDSILENWHCRISKHKEHSKEVMEKFEIIKMAGEEWSEYDKW
eukprot:TRINITY_DN780363_c0_g1_i1.p1 TRINITY_DN780363_c0_g1~~TRINITY_DN780363_c0_g1_i1.p1  ORF type:complete len:103 (-),score=11.40 TRINITY_DN780363_c0_g1_i1:171-479(-)